MFTEATIRQMRQLHQQAMMDECDLLAHLPGGTDPYNMPEPDDYVYANTLPCSYKPVKAGEELPLTDVPTLDGILSFDRSVEETHQIEIRSLDRFRLTRLHGDLLAQPLLLEVVGQPKRDDFAIVLPVKKVRDE
jgi:hypothetical protein